MKRGGALLLAALVAGACDGRDRGREPESGPPAARDTIRLDDDFHVADSVPLDPTPADSTPPDTAPEDSVVPGDSSAPPDPGAEWTVGILRGGTASAGVATLIEVRAGRHAEFDRAVWTFREGRPAWRAEYVDRPVRECGSGRAVPLPGDGWLEVRFEPARAHDDAGRPTVGGPGAPGATPGLARVLAVARTCDFEAVVAHVLAVDSPEPFRVLELDDPPRLVVDVRHGP